MNKFKFCVIILIVAILTTTCICPIALAEPQNGTAVNVRCIFKSTMSLAYCTLTLHRFSDMESTTPINDESFSSTVDVTRISHWEKTIHLEPGFYEIIHVSVPGLNPLNIKGHSERFEVKGDLMTVYVAVDRPEEPVPMPDEWLVYGEDTQNFYIWADESETSDNDTTSSDESDSKPETSTEDLPGDIDTSIEEEHAPQREENSIPDTPIKPIEKETPTSVKIGNYLYLFIVGGLLLVSFILLKRIQRQRYQ